MSTKVGSGYSKRQSRQTYSIDTLISIDLIPLLSYIQLELGKTMTHETNHEEYECTKHGVNLERLPAGYEQCPLCAEEARIEAQRAEEMARQADPRMHPTVDAPRW